MRLMAATAMRVTEMRHPNKISTSITVGKHTMAAVFSLFTQP